MIIQVSGVLIFTSGAFPTQSTIPIELGPNRVTKRENLPDSKIFVAKTFRIKSVNCVNFQIRDKCA